MMSVIHDTTLSPVKKVGRILLRVLIYALLVLGAVLIVFPFVWMVLGSFKMPLDANSAEFRFLPVEWVTNNYTDLFTNANFPIIKAFFNTVIVEVSVIVVGTFVSALAAFSFAKLKLQHMK